MDQPGTKMLDGKSTLDDRQTIEVEENEENSNEIMNNSMFFRSGFMREFIYI